MNTLSREELLERAKPVAQAIMDRGCDEETNFIVWIAALKLAAKIEVESYIIRQDASAEFLRDDVRQLDTLIDNLIVTESGREPTEGPRRNRIAFITQLPKREGEPS